MDEYMADNAAMESQDTVESFAEDGAAAVETQTQEEYTTDSPENGMESQEDLQQETAEQDVTQTQAFSRRLREKSEQAANQAVDQFVASMGVKNPYTGQPIRTRSEFDQYRQMFEAQKRGQDPVIASQIATMQNELNSYKMRDQEQQLLNDPQRSEIYKALQPEVRQLLDYCHRNGMRNVDLQTAFNTVLSNRLPEVMKLSGQKMQQETVKKISANAAATPGSLGKAGDAAKPDFSKMSDSEFDSWVKRAERGELMKS